MSKGRHRAPRTPSTIGPTLAKAGAVALAATGPIAIYPTAAEAAPSSTSILEVIAKCESGNKNVNHNSALSGIKSTASGYLQILDSTWKAFGGTQFASRAINASREEQFIVGARILVGQGINAWSPSKGCWGSKISTAKPEAVITPEPKKFKVDPSKEQKKITPKTIVKKVSPPAKAVTSAPKKIKKQSPAPPAPLAPLAPTAHIARKAASSYLIRRGDSLSKIAAAHHMKGGWKALFNANRDTVKNPNLIYTGNHLRLG